MGAAIGSEILAPLLGPPSPTSGVLREDLVYTSFPTPQWWDPLVGQPVRVTDFAEWQGATAVWRGFFRNGGFVPHSGFPVLVIRVKRDTAYLQVPSEFSPPPGYQFFHDDPSRDLRIVVAFARCTHLCCNVGWQTLPPDYPPLNNYFAPSPTHDVFGQIPMYCPCHDAQYDPLVLVSNFVPWGSFSYLGLMAVGGPARLGLPVVPVKAIDNVLFGGMGDPRWYEYC